jgi:dTDP-4-amino-4,6-dideoxygalactose transaminase
VTIGQEQMLSRIDVMKPWLGAEESQAVAEVIASACLAQGPRVARFEEAFAAEQQAGQRRQLRGRAAGFRRRRGGNRECVRTDHSRGLDGATRAVIVVDQGGMPVDLEPIRNRCDPLGVTVIEDSSCGAGSTYRGRPVGAGAELAAWSFHPRNILTTGEGGMLTTPKAEWAVRARQLRGHGMSVSAYDRSAAVLAPAEDCLEVGFNYRMTELQAAVGLVQLGRLPEAVARRRAIVASYREALGDVKGLRFSRDPLYGTSNFQSFWFEVQPAFALGREVLLAHLAHDGISGRRGTMAAHRQPAYSGRDTGGADLSVTERLTDNTVILPVYHQLSPDERSRVVCSLLRAGRRRTPG